MKLTLLNRLGRNIRNLFWSIVGISFLYIALWFTFVGSSVEVKYNIHPIQKTVVMRVKSTIWDKALNIMDYARRVKDIWL